MTQMQAPTFEAESAPTGEPVRTSGLAITSLICSLIFCCPCTTILGVLLGLISIPVISGNPARKGKGLAIVAILIGLVATGVQFAGYRWSDKNFSKPVEEGPRAALTAAFAGDPASFKDDMFGPAATATDAEVQAFVDDLRARYGEFQTCSLDEAAMMQKMQNMQASDWMSPTKDFTYTLEFTNGTVSADITSASVDESTGEFLWGTKFGSITIIDADRGDLIFPPGGAQPATPPSVPAIERSEETAPAPDASGG